MYVVYCRCQRFDQARLNPLVGSHVIPCSANLPPPPPLCVFVKMSSFIGQVQLSIYSLPYHQHFLGQRVVSLQNRGEAIHRRSELYESGATLACSTECGPWSIITTNMLTGEAASNSRFSTSLDLWGPNSAYNGVSRPLACLYLVQGFGFFWGGKTYHSSQKHDNRLLALCPTAVLWLAGCKSQDTGSGKIPQPWSFSPTPSSTMQMSSMRAIYNLPHPHGVPTVPPANPNPHQSQNGIFSANSSSALDIITHTADRLPLPAAPSIKTFPTPSPRRSTTTITITMPLSSPASPSAKPSCGTSLTL